MMKNVSLENLNRFAKRMQISNALQNYDAWCDTILASINLDKENKILENSFAVTDSENIKPSLFNCNITLNSYVKKKIDDCEIISEMAENLDDAATNEAFVNYLNVHKDEILTEMAALLTDKAKKEMELYDGDEQGNVEQIKKLISSLEAVVLCLNYEMTEHHYTVNRNAEITKVENQYIAK